MELQPELNQPTQTDRGIVRQDSDRGAFGALFPEVPIEAERQALYLSLIVGALVFSAIMGWGPHGRWLTGLTPGHGTKTAVAVAPRPEREGTGSVRNTKAGTIENGTGAKAETDVTATTLAVVTGETSASLEEGTTEAPATDLDPLEILPSILPIDSAA